MRGSVALSVCSGLRSDKVAVCAVLLEACMQALQILVGFLPCLYMFSCLAVKLTGSLYYLHSTGLFALPCNVCIVYPPSSAWSALYTRQSDLQVFEV